MVDFATRRRMMVDTQVRPSDVTKYPIIDALLETRREVFVPDELREVAYAGENIDLGGGRVVLDARTLAKMLDALDIHPNELVLDIGAGLGYSAAVIGRLAEAVVAVEAQEDWAEEAENLLSREGADNVAVVKGALDGGSPRHGPFDVITLQGGIQILPQAIADQLKDGGRIAALFVEGALGTVKIGRKSGGRIDWRPAFNAGAPILPGFESAKTFAL